MLTPILSTSCVKLAGRSGYKQEIVDWKKPGAFQFLIQTAVPGTYYQTLFKPLCLAPITSPCSNRCAWYLLPDPVQTAVPGTYYRPCSNRCAWYLLPDPVQTAVPGTYYQTLFKPLCLVPITSPCSKTYFILPIHHLNSTHTQSMSQLSEGLKLYL
jgi:hypothetical protein